MNVENAKKRLLSKFTAKNLESAVLDITKLRTEHFRELTSDEVMQVFYLFFPLEKPNTAGERLAQLEKEQELKKLRSIILRDAEYMGIYKNGDWKRFNAFMLNKSPLKKTLNRYKKQEFEALIKQFKSMKQKFDKQKMIVGTSQWDHFTGMHIKPSMN